MKRIADGNTLCSEVAFLFSEVAAIYPITPSSPMASNIDKLNNEKELNIFNRPVSLIEMQSEAGAAGTMHGALITGSLATTFTASQGLLLMIPNMYKIAGELLPGVIHVASRSIATHALSIFGDHQDIYATRQTGFCMLASSSVKDAYYLSAIAHLSSIRGSLPFLHFFDGFRTSHEINTVDVIDKLEFLKLIDNDKLNEFKNRGLKPDKMVTKGTNQNEDIFFQVTESRNIFYDNIPDIVNNYMESINEIAKTDYKPFNYYGSNNAINVIIAMGSVTDTIKEVVDDLNQKNNNVGVIIVHLYRPFSKKYLVEVMPKSVKNIAVLDRTKENGSTGEPLYLDVLSTLNGMNINIVGGRYGLSSKNTTPKDIYSVFKMLDSELKTDFTIGIVDDVTNKSLESYEYEINNKYKEIKIYGFGSDGMVSASKEIIKIIGENNGYAQGYFEYDSKKSGSVTVANLRFSDNVINSPYYVMNPKIVVVTKDEYLEKYDMFSTIKKDGIVIINTGCNKLEFINKLNNETKQIFKEQNIKIIIIDASKIANDNNIKGKINKIVEVILLKLLGLSNALELVSEKIKKEFITKGQDIIDNNIKAIKESIDKLLIVENSFKIDDNNIIKEESYNVYEMINKREGNLLKVSDVMSLCDGSIIGGLSKYEKREISNVAPKWIPENCIQCGLCSFVCPHSVIRSFITKDKGIPLNENKENKYLVSVSEKDCTGCGLCINACPGKLGKKALELGNIDEEKQKEADYYFNEHKNIDVINKYSIKGSQLQKPLFEFCGACAGCGESGYLKLLTQLYGSSLVIGNATGCSSIYGGSPSSTPYSVSWANSLFEDNAEFSYGMLKSLEEKHNQIKKIMELSKETVNEEIKELYNIWLNNQEDFEKTLEVKNKLKDLEIPKELKELIDYIPAYKIFAIGGDGFAYDIGFGGLDHVLSSNDNINVLILDTEVYSNTGGQMSKSTNIGAIAEFANFGKRTNKKDLFKIAMCYPNCYVGSISMGANYNQTIKVIKEAVEHQGPSLIIAYSPCIEHGIKGGLFNSLKEQKLAVETGYILLMHYNPVNEKLVIDSPEPNFNIYEEFLNNEVRFNALKIKDEKLAKELLENQKENAIKRYNYYKKYEN